MRYMMQMTKLKDICLLLIIVVSIFCICWDLLKLNLHNGCISRNGLASQLFKSIASHKYANSQLWFSLRLLLWGNMIVWLFNLHKALEQLEEHKLLPLVWIKCYLTRVATGTSMLVSLRDNFQCPISQVKVMRVTIKIAEYLHCFSPVNHHGIRVWKVVAHKQGTRQRWDTMRKRKHERMWFISVGLYNCFNLILPWFRSFDFIE